MTTVDMKRALRRIRQFGGWRLLWEYTKMGLLPVVVREGLQLLTGKRDFDRAYQTIGREVNSLLLKRYTPLMYRMKDQYDHAELEHTHRDVVWFCWLQGLDMAPDLVKACYNSIRQHVRDRELVVITHDNLHEYINLPPHVVDRYERGQMPPALFSDMVRLELLIRYGGTWMDASLLCTGSDWPDGVMDADLFLFQTLRKGDRTFYGASNWFITASANNPVLLVLRDVLSQYWKDYSCTLQYYMFHLFLYQLARIYPDEIAAMPKRNRLRALQLVNRLSDRYDAEAMTEMERVSNCHKLNYRVAERLKDPAGTFYAEVIRRYGTDV